MSTIASTSPTSDRTDTARRTEELINDHEYVKNEGIPDPNTMIHVASTSLSINSDADSEVFTIIHILWIFEFSLLNIYITVGPVLSYSNDPFTDFGTVDVQSKPS